MRRRLIGGALEVRVAKAAVAAARNQNALARGRQVGQQRFAVFSKHLRARRHLDHAIIAVSAGTVLAHTALAGLGFEVLLVAIIDQGVEVGDAFNPDIAALAAVAAIGSAELDEFLTPETDAAVAARARRHIDFCRIEKFHGASALIAVVQGRRRS